MHICHLQNERGRRSFYCRSVLFLGRIFIFFRSPMNLFRIYIFKELFFSLDRYLHVFCCASIRNEFAVIDKGHGEAGKFQFNFELFQTVRSAVLRYKYLTHPSLISNQKDSVLGRST